MKNLHYPDSVSVGSTRETSKSNVEAMEGTKASNMKRVHREHQGDEEGQQLAPGIFLDRGQTTEEDLDTAISNLAVMKLKKAGKYSIRYKNHGDGEQKTPCNNCSSLHDPGICPAKGKTCFLCEESDHFARSKACKGTAKKKTTKKLTED